jgi:hypothetical protein
MGPEDVQFGIVQKYIKMGNKKTGDWKCVQQAKGHCHGIMSMALAAPFVPGNYHSKFCSTDNKTHAAIKQSLGSKPEALCFYNALTSYIKGLCNEKTVGKGDSNLMIDWNCVVGNGAKQPFGYCRSSSGNKKVSQGIWSNASHPILESLNFVFREKCVDVVTYLPPKLFVQLPNHCSQCAGDCVVAV